MRTFEFKDDKSNKFWNIEVVGTYYQVRFGKIGSNGQTQRKTFATADAAQAEADKLIREKLKKGYTETSTTPAAPPKPVSTEQKALEAALLAHPDEVAAHSAYADYLSEHDDPRGAFIQTQLALEDPSRAKPERAELQKREKALMKKHARDWIGDAGRFLVGGWSGEDRPYHFALARGWLDFVRTMPVPQALVAALAQSPQTRLLRRLEVVYDMRYHAFSLDEAIGELNAALPDADKVGEDDWYEMLDPVALLPALAASPHLTNLRVLKYGFSDDHKDGPSHSTMLEPFYSSAAELLDVLKACPRLEELYLNTELHPIDDVFSSKRLGNLRVFQYYYGTNYSHHPRTADPYPLSVLAQNKALKDITTLRFHPGRDTTIDIDEFDALLRSKNLPALAHLQVHMTTFGDEGADRIVASGVLKRLKTLDIGYGNMTDAGADVLAASADLKSLDVLTVSQNALTPAGVKALKKAGVRSVVADAQHATDEEYPEYLYGVDVE